jgi:glycosyltransferase involved in cell wall biosynthesis
MEKIAIVVQRCHESVIGGSESEALHFGQLLKDNYEIDILTTTAVDIIKWKNILKEGDERKNGICIKRFKVSQERTEYWHKINELLIKKHNKTKNLKKIKDRIIEWTIALQEEFIYKQGPYSDDLINYLSKKYNDYKAILFFTYLYAPTYYGMQYVPKEKIIFIPTLHNEPQAYLSVFKYAARRARLIIWNTYRESLFGKSLWGELPGKVIGMGVNIRKYSPARSDFPYLLYCGRIDVNKGCLDLVDYYLRFKKDFPSDLRLVLTGDLKIELPEDKSIIFKGFVSDKEKFELMSGAEAFIMPSPYESFSIVTLEAMAQKTPVLASTGSDIIVDHIEKSNGGLLYRDYESFKKGIDLLLNNKKKSSDLGKNGSRYVNDNYSNEKISKKLKDLLNNIE